ncbi:MAG: SLBB domain-containing protein [Fidelibacterota bacterium]|nr:MAG: SLBB domain-containing protein [Candidatus Neomarinimicrobiota bacterium]
MIIKISRAVLGSLALISTAASQIQLPTGKAQLREEPIQQLVPAYKAQVVGTALEQAVDPTEYVVGPGDQFMVSILSTEPHFELATVTPTGSIILSGIGSLAVAGLTAKEVSREVIRLIEGMFPNYEATCLLYGIREIRVSVTGAVRRAGFHEVTPLSRVTDLIGEAGGVLASAMLHRVQLIRGTTGNRTLNLVSYYNDGDISQNPRLVAGDQIIVPYLDVTQDLVAVRGLAPTPTYYAILPGENLAYFLKRISYGNQADLTKVTLQRGKDGGGSEQFEVPSGDYASIDLEPGDILYIDRIVSIAVVGEVRNPGRYAYQPGLTAADYVMLAGGVTREGSPRKVETTGTNGRARQGGDTPIAEGDTVYIPRSFNSVFLGQLGMIQAALTFLNIYLAYLAARGT